MYKGEYIDVATCANGAQYRKDIHGFLPEMMQRIYDERKIYKSKMLRAKQEYETTPTVALEKDIARFNNIQMARRFNSTVPMVQSETNTSDTTIWQTLRQSHSLVRLRFVGLQTK